MRHVPRMLTALLTLLALSRGSAQEPALPNHYHDPLHNTRMERGFESPRWYIGLPSLLLDRTTREGMVWWHQHQPMMGEQWIYPYLVREATYADYAKLAEAKRGETSSSVPSRTGMPSVEEIAPGPAVDEPGMPQDPHSYVPR